MYMIGYCVVSILMGHWFIQRLVRIKV